MTLLQAMDPMYSTNAELIRCFYQTTRRRSSTAASAGEAREQDRRRWTSSIRPRASRAGEIMIESGQQDHQERRRDHLHFGRHQQVDVMNEPSRTRCCSTRLHEDNTSEPRRSAASRSTSGFAPGNPPQLEKRPRCSSRSSSTPTATAWAASVASASTASSTLDVAGDRDDRLRPEDFIDADQLPAASCVAGESDRPTIDDIDHLGNRRLRTIDELACDELRKGFLKLRRTVQERMSLKDVDRHDAAQPDQPQERLGGDRVLLRPRRAVASRRPDEPALDAHARASAVGPRPGRFEPQASRLRSPRRAHFALRPHLPDRNAGRHEHRSDLELGDLRHASTSTASSVTPYRKVKNGEVDRQRSCGSAPTKRRDAYPRLRPTRRSKNKARSSAARRSSPAIGSDFEVVPTDKIEYTRRRRSSQMIGVSAALDSVPRTRRRQPRVDGFEHAAASGAAA